MNRPLDRRLAPKDASLPVRANHERPTQPLEPPEPLAPPVPETRARDRERIGAGPIDGAHSVIGVRTQDSASDELFDRMRLAVLRSKQSDRGQALSALETLEQAPDGLRTAAALLLHRRSEKISDEDLKQLPAARSIDRESLVKRLVFWRQRPEAAESMAGMPEPLYSALASAFVASNDPELRSRAVAYISGTRSDRSTWMIGGFLAAIGELPPGDNALADPARALANLARRREGLALERDGVLPKLEDRLLDDPVQVQALRSALTHGEARAHPKAGPPIAGLDDPAACETVRQAGLGVERGNRRGALGELLRLWQLQHDPRDAGKILIRGLRLVSSPPALRALHSADEAVAWCRAAEPPIDEHRLFRVATESGSYFGIMRTEIDVAVFEVEGDKLRPVRIENVKAGLGSSQDARSQNRVALEVLRDAGSACVLTSNHPGDGISRDLAPLLDLSAATLDKLETVTVGPSDDPRYDLALPLTGWDLSQLAMRL